MEIVWATIGVVRHEGAVLMLKRRPDDRWFPGCWCFPGGRIDPGESPEEGLTREIEEETGLTGVTLHQRFGVLESPWPARGRLYKVHCFELFAPRRGIRLSMEHSDARWVEQRVEVPTPLAGRITQQLLELVLPTA